MLDLHVNNIQERNLTHLISHNKDSCDRIKKSVWLIRRHMIEKKLKGKFLVQMFARTPLLAIIFSVRSVRSRKGLDTQV